MLVIVKDRNVAALFELFLDLEALRGSDVLEVDATEGRCEELAEADDFLRVLAVDLEVEDIDVGKSFEEDTLALHHRFAGHRSDVSESKHGRAIRHYRYQIALVGVFVDQLGIAGDLQTGLGHPRGVGQRQIALGDARFGRDHLGLSVAFAGVVCQGLFTRDFLHDYSPRQSVDIRPGSSTRGQ